MVDPQTTLGEQLLDLAIGERKAQVPADREQDHLRLKLAPLEQSGNRWGEEHRPSLSGQATKVATLPVLLLPWSLKLAPAEVFKQGFKPLPCFFQAFGRITQP